VSARRRPREILALIPARGGSKGLPRKNICMVAGKPLVAYSIEQALASRSITRTIVSTDDEEIAAVARQYGAEVPFMRPRRFAGDRSSDLDVFRHALTWLRDREGYTCDLVVHLRPTAPVRGVALIEKAIACIAGRPRAHSLRSVSRAQQTPYKMWRIRDGVLHPLLRIPGSKEGHSQARQQLPPVYWQNGLIDIVRPHVVLKLGMIAGRTIVPFVIDEPVPGLDCAEDLPQLECALAALSRGEWPMTPPARQPYAV
jgi:N-acylneuraminate cytidylyltransferase